MRLVSLLAASFGLLAMTAEASGAETPSTSPRTSASPIPDHEWNAVFDRHDGWTGADGAGTVDLGDGRVLWLFGDTWIGSIRGGKRMPGATMVNNSIAVHSIGHGASGRAPDPKNVQFYWGQKDTDGRPTAWVAPPKTGAGREHQWYWPTGGGLAVRTPAGSHRLFVFFFRVQTNPKGKGVWTFTVLGTTLGVVDNLAESPERWKVKLFDVPHSLRSVLPRSKSADAEMTWGMTACLDPESSKDGAQRALIFGIRKTGLLNDALVLARAPAAAVEQFDQWTFYARNNSWLSAAREAAPLANGMVSEFSIEPVRCDKQAEWLLVQSEPLLGKRIFVRLAPKPEGPWSAPKAVALVPDVDRNRAYFTYAAKGHAVYSRPGEVLITYLVNSNQFADLVTDTAIYRPQFLRFAASAFCAP
jgi:hypothetical protein